MRLLTTGGSGFIGTNVVQHFCSVADETLNVDLSLPLDHAQTGWFRKGDILDEGRLKAIFAEFAPDHVIHLAARAECDENTTVEEGYQANTTGTAHLLEAVKATPSVRRLIVVSSQFVCGPGWLPQHDEDFFPCTVYGQSKVITEQLTRGANLNCCWTIIRPTNIWGPWHMRYREQLWRVMKRGLYVHPGGGAVIRSYGYVGNIAHQMGRIFDLPEETVHGQVFYVGDEPVDLLEWVNAFSLALRGRPVRIVPRLLLRGAGLLGDAITAVRCREFLITSSRYQSMISDYPTPMAKTFAVLGPSPVSLEEGVALTKQWLESYDPGDGLRY